MIGPLGGGGGGVSLRELGQQSQPGTSSHSLNGAGLPSVCRGQALGILSAHEMNEVSSCFVYWAVRASLSRRLDSGQTLTLATVAMPTLPTLFGVCLGFFAITCVIYFKKKNKKALHHSHRANVF